MSKIVMAEQSSAPDTPGSGKVAIYVDTDGSLCWRKDDGVIVKIASAGTYTLTIPATGTAALLGTAQTFSAAQTFSGVLTAPGMKPASNSTTAIQLQNAAGTAILTVDSTNNIVKSLTSNADRALVGDGVATRYGFNLSRISAGASKQLTITNLSNTTAYTVNLTAVYRNASERFIFNIYTDSSGNVTFSSATPTATIIGTSSVGGVFALSLASSAVRTAVITIANTHGSSNLDYPGVLIEIVYGAAGTITASGSPLIAVS